MWYPFKKPNLEDVRGSFDNVIKFIRAPSVPTIRILTSEGQAHLEIGRRARLRDNSLYDSYDNKAFDITSPPTLIKAGNSIELGYVTHPKGVTLELVSGVNIIAVDQFGHPKKQGELIYDEQGKETEKRYITTHYSPVEMKFEGTVGTLAALDDWNESTGHYKEGGWILPLIIGIIIGVVFIAPFFAWIMAKAAGR